MEKIVKAINIVGVIAIVGLAVAAVTDYHKQDNAPMPRHTMVIVIR